MPVFIHNIEHELEEKFVTSGGPGGQNVNKVATAVQLRFDAGRSPALTDAMRQRLAVLAGLTVMLFAYNV